MSIRELKSIGVLNPTRVTVTMCGDAWNDATGEPFVIEMDGHFFVGEVVHTVQDGRKFVMTVENFERMKGVVDDHII